MEKHTTVLLREAVDALAITAGATVVDATLGSGGHAQEIVARLGVSGTYIGIDADQSAIDAQRDVLKGTCHVNLKVGNFRDIDSILNTTEYGKPDSILADLGWRMEQFSGNGKGFSFQIDEPLIMTYGDASLYPFTAHDVVNEWEEEHIRTILEAYGEERYASRIVRGILQAREAGEIKTTFDLVKIIESSVPVHYKTGKINPATRTFQALRIAVNDELSALEEFMERSLTLLKDNGRLAIITFHSLEDRMVKHTFRAFERDQRGIVLTKKPITPNDDEIIRNKRARSAKLRVFEKHESTAD
jgi:16S rRNA (cytosine1402-N4)-methyltransferase